jgi:hypothetical protein
MNVIEYMLNNILYIYYKHLPQGSRFELPMRVLR